MDRSDHFPGFEILQRGDKLVKKRTETTAPSLVSKSDSIEFTGERYIPEVDGQIAFEHFHRYRFAAQFIKGKRVLDVACGEGYGSDLLAANAKNVVGLDIAREVILHAQARYPRENLKFVTGSAAKLPFESATFDVVVSFETIEHHNRHQEMVSEIRRVLDADGLLIISSPNKQHYSIEPGYRNPFHVKELFREELLALLNQHFSHISVYGQRVVHGSLIVPEGNARFESALQDGKRLATGAGLLNPLYDLVIAGNRELPPEVGSLFEMKVHGMDPATFYGAHLQDRVNLADQELVQLNYEVQQKEASLSELSTHVDALTVLRAEHEPRLQALATEVQVLRVELNARDGRMDALQQVIAEKETRLLAASEQKRQLDAWLAELRLHAGNLESRIQEADVALAAAIARGETLSAQRVKEELLVASLEQWLAEKGKRLDDAEMKLHSLEANLEDSRIHATSLESRSAEQEKKIASLEAALGAARNHAKGLESGGSEQEKKIASLEAALGAARNHAKGLESGYSEKQNKIASLEVMLEAARNHAKGLESGYSEKEKKIALLEAMLEAARNHAKGLESEYSRKEEQIASLEGELANSRMHIGNLENEHAEMVRRMNEMVSSRSWRYTSMFRRHKP